MENTAQSQVSIRHIGPVFFVPERKPVLDYYSRLGFWCDYDMGFVEWDGVGFIVHESPTAPAAPNNPAYGSSALDAFCMVSDVEALFTAFKAKGAEFLYELRTNDYNMREFAIKDPAGFALGFGQ